MKKMMFISGSLRDESLNRKLLNAFAAALPSTVEPLWADINLPLFNEDVEAEKFPDACVVFRDQVIAADSIVIATPEYNRGMSGALKNAIDWASRPYGKNAWEDKQVLVTSASPSGIGGALALYQVKQSLLHLKANVLSHPEFMVAQATDKFDAAGVLVDDTTQTYVDRAVRTLLK